MELKGFLDTLAADTAFWMVGLQDPDYPLGQLGSLAENVSEKLRTLAIVTLMVEGNTNGFYHNLIRSGLAREVFLKRCHAEGFGDFHLAISRSGAFFDSLAANDFDLAKRIALLSPQNWVPDGEYEDDYCFTQFFHLLVLEKTAETGLAPLLVQFEISLQGDESAGLDVCRALASRDQRAFDGAFDALIEHHDGHLAEEQKRGRMEDAHVVAERQIFTEGLGILRIAERLGLQTQEEYKYCPALARLPMTKPFPGQ
jgi:hypothetical protein